jgi:hypothetical protein
VKRAPHACSTIWAAWHCVVDAEGRALGLVGDRHDLLLAWSGGHPVTLVAEWDGYALAPLAAWSPPRVLALAGTVA